MDNKQAALIAAAMTFSGVTLSHDDGEMLSQEDRDATVMQTADRFLDWLEEGIEEEDGPSDVELYDIGDDDYEDYPLIVLREAAEARKVETRDHPPLPNKMRLDDWGVKEFADWLRRDDMMKPTVSEG